MPISMFRVRGATAFIFTTSLFLSISPLAAQEAAPAPTASPLTGSAVPGPAGLEVVWADSLSKAIAEARTKPKGRVLVSFIEKDCAECDRMDSLVVPSTTFFSFTRDKVPVRVALSSEEGRKLGERFSVRKVPAWVVMTPDLLLCGIQVGSTTQSGWIRTFVEAEQHWAEYTKRLADEEKDPSNEELVFAVALETYQRRGDGLAEPRFRRLAQGRGTPVKIREASLAYLASIELDSERVEDAAKNLTTLLRIGEDPVLKERAELRLAEVELARGRRDRAIQKLEAFRKKHPESPLAKNASELLELLRKEPPRKE